MEDDASCEQAPRNSSKSVLAKSSDSALDDPSTESSSKSNLVIPPRPKSAVQFVTSADNLKLRLAEAEKRRRQEVAKEAELQLLYKSLGYSDEILRKAAEMDAAATKANEQIRLRTQQIHSAPPAVDRSRFGLRILAKHGYDAKSGRGLGAQEQGITTPIELAQKLDKTGIGITPRAPTPKKEPTASVPPGVKKSMNAKECREQAAREKKRAATLEKLFYSDRHDEFFHELEKPY